MMNMSGFRGVGQCHFVLLYMALGLVQDFQSTLTLILSLSIKWSHNSTDSISLGCDRLIHGFWHGAKVRFPPSGLHSSIICQRRGTVSLYFQEYKASSEVKLQPRFNAVGCWVKYK